MSCSGRRSSRYGKDYGVTRSRFQPGMTDCSLCGLCVRYCAEVKKAGKLYFKGRGVDRAPAMLDGSPHCPAPAAANATTCAAAAGLSTAPRYNWGQILKNEFSRSGPFFLQTPPYKCIVALWNATYNTTIVHTIMYSGETAYANCYSYGVVGGIDRHYCCAPRTGRSQGRTDPAGDFLRSRMPSRFYDKVPECAGRA